MATIKVQISARTPGQAAEPIIYRIGKDYQVVTNIVRAQISEESAFAEIAIEGELEEVQRAIAWLMTTGLDVSAQERSVGVDTVNL